MQQYFRVQQYLRENYDHKIFLFTYIFFLQDLLDTAIREHSILITVYLTR